MAAQPLAGLSILAGYSYNNARYTKTDTTKGSFIEGEQLVNNPTNTANASIFYTINKGEMDAFLKHFKEDVMAVHERIGVPIVGTWVNRPQNEFIWIRTYKDKADLEAKGRVFQAEVAKAGIKLGTNVAKMEVREVETAFTP